MFKTGFKSWVTILTVGYDQDVVRTYDSMNLNLSGSLKILADIFQTRIRLYTGIC